MSATFAAPVASVVLAVELLLFEWKPRSVIPVALAAVTAAASAATSSASARCSPSPSHPAFIGWAGLAGCVLVGLLAGVLSAILTGAVYAAEDTFQRLPIHWMWWPAIGGLIIGLGGFIFPQALGVGYDVIDRLLQDSPPMRLIAGVLLVKSLIWALSLGSGTSGGVLAPLLMMGAALGGLEATMLPAEGAGFWPLVSMGAILGGTMRAPLTGVVFALELTTCCRRCCSHIAHGFTVLSQAIDPHEISRRGYHLSREYSMIRSDHLRARGRARSGAGCSAMRRRTASLALTPTNRCGWSPIAWPRPASRTAGRLTTGRREPRHHRIVRRPKR